MHKATAILWLLSLSIIFLATTIKVTAATKYSSQIIAVMGNSEIEQKAAEYLYEKNPGVSTIVSWNDNKQIFEYKKGKILDTMDLDFRKVRIQVVGHGDPNGHTLSGKSPSEIASALNELYPEESRGISETNEQINEISRVSLVCCKCAYEGDDAGKSFASDLITDLKTSYSIDTSVTARNTITTVDSSGKKLTGTMNKQTKKIKWRHKDPSAKKVYTLDDQNNVVSKSAAYEGDLITCSLCGITSHGLMKEDVEEDVEEYKSKGGVKQTLRFEKNRRPSKHIRLTQDYLYDQLDRVTRAIFDNAEKENGEWISTAEEKRFVVREPTRTGVVNVERRVRIINSVKDLVNEINYFGRNGPQAGEQYYKFGDFICKLDTHNFYINDEGYMGVAMLPVPDEEQYKQPLTETQCNTLAETSQYSWLQRGNIPTVGENYNQMTEVNNNFFYDMRSFMFGNNGDIRAPDFRNWEEARRSATNAQRALAMTLSESIRNFRTHPVNLIAVGLGDAYHIKPVEYFDSHPMARGGTWPPNPLDPDQKHPTLPRPTGYDGTYGGYSLGDDSILNADQKKTASNCRKRMTDFLGNWLSKIGKGRIKIQMPRGEYFLEQDDPKTEKEVANIEDLQEAMVNRISDGLFNSLLDLHNNPEEGGDYLYDNPNIAGALLASTGVIDTPEIEVVNQNVENLVDTDSRTLPLVTSQTLEGDQEVIAHEIANRVQEQNELDGKEYSIVEKSLEREENEIKFKVIDSSEPPEEKEIEIELNEEKLGSDDIVNDVKGRVSTYTNNKRPSKFSQRVQKVGESTAIAGTVRGLLGAIGALEDGQIKDGLVGIAQAAYGIGSLTGINEDMYRLAGESISNFIKGDTIEVAEDVSKSAAFSNELSEGAKELESTLGREGTIFAEDIPYVGIAFGIYNIAQDFSKHSVIGYVDAALDIAITGLDMFGAATGIGEAVTVPITVALNVIRMFIDDFYNGVKEEFDKLPAGASVGQKIGAFFTGIKNALFDIFEQWTLIGQIYGAVSNSRTLNDEYYRDRELLRNLSNYENYFKVEKEKGSNTEEINFADGSTSWNGGAITFHLMDGEYSLLELEETVDQNGNKKTLEKDIPRDPYLQDIVLGIGESHSISFKTVSVKFFWFIPVDTKKVIDGLNGERSSLHGTYFGNSQNNRFFAVQKQPPNLTNYSISDYHYNLYGREGNDTFYLGPQYAYVMGGEGADAYYISQNSTHTYIDNFAADQITDNLVTTTTFSDLQLSKRGYNLYITSRQDGHNITLYDWFRGVLYQHMNFRSGDGFLFWITVERDGEARFDPYAWSKGDSKKGVTLDLSQKGLPFESVITLVGSNFSDSLIGNAKDNQINGLSGDDYMRGGNGKDTYVIEATQGTNTINNFALDETQDFVLFNAHHKDLNTRLQDDNLVIFDQHKSLSITLEHWFINSSYQHLLLVSNDAVLIKISSSASDPNLLRLLFVDMDLLKGSKFLVMDEDEISVIGSMEDDRIIGNSNNNYFSPGNGDDYIKGGEGQDTYVIRPGEGNDDIYNFALDGQQDTVLFGAGWNEIWLTKEDDNLILSVDHKKMSVRLLQWFVGTNYQHLLVRTNDGVIFALPNSPDDLILKTILFVDGGNWNTGLKLDIMKSPWKNVTRVSGSKYDNAVSGNDQDTVVDPGAGQAFLRGRNGHDTYVIKANYSHGNIIYNYAEDQLRDTLVFEVPYSHIVVHKQACHIELSSNLTSGNTSVLLVDFMFSPKQQHLLITSSDGISFVLPENTEYEPVPLIINLARKPLGQTLNLKAEGNYSTIQSVFGSLTGSNHLIGNEQNNTLVGGSKPDTLFGEEGYDIVKGGADDDELHGGPDNDILDGGSGNDKLYGEEGDDVLVPGTGVDLIDGGDGTDIILCTGTPLTATGSYINLEEETTVCNNGSDVTLVSVEGIYGSAYNDMIIDSAGDNRLVGNVGNDTIIVSEGYDIINGGPGFDTYDLNNANGTKIIVNFANDLKKDVVLMSYANKSSIRYGRSEFDLIVRVAFPGYPEGYFDATKPTMVITNWYLGDEYKHIEFQAHDGVVIPEVIETYASYLVAFTYEDFFGGKE